MTHLELSVSDGTIWSITLESSIAILEASFKLIYDAHSTSITYDDHQLTIVNVFIVQATVAMPVLKSCINITIINYAPTVMLPIVSSLYVFN
jgi:hypothetical protein